MARMPATGRVAACSSEFRTWDLSSNGTDRKNCQRGLGKREGHHPDASSSTVSRSARACHACRRRRLLLIDRNMDMTKLGNGAHERGLSRPRLACVVYKSNILCNVVLDDVRAARCKSPPSSTEPSTELYKFYSAERSAGAARRHPSSCIHRH